MIITKTPFRMSFFGGGTDMPDYFKNKKGAVISTTFDKYCYVTVRHLPPFFDYTTELVYSKIERISKLDDMVHPLVRNTMKYLDMHELRINYESDLPARSGLGTSSSFAVGMLNAFYSLKGKFASKEKLANDAIYIEREMCKEAGGWQDQIAAAYGGLNRIDFNGDEYSVKPIVMSPERKQQLDNNLVLFFTGFTRFSSDVQKSNQSKEDKEKILDEMYKLVDEAENILIDDKINLDEFGKLLDKTWRLKRQTGNNVSTDSIDALYERAIKAGALGGKLLGAGAGGFLLFYCPIDKQDNLKNALGDLLHVPFNFENGGTRVVYYTPEFYDIEKSREK